MYIIKRWWFWNSSRIPMKTLIIIADGFAYYCIFLGNFQPLKSRAKCPHIPSLQGQIVLANNWSLLGPRGHRRDNLGCYNRLAFYHEATLISEKKKSFLKISLSNVHCRMMCRSEFLKKKIFSQRMRTRVKTTLF